MTDRKSWHMCLQHKLYKSQNLALSPQLLPGQLLTTSWTVLPFGRWQDTNHIETNPRAPMPRQAHSLAVGCTAGWCAGGGRVCGSRPLQVWPWTTLRSKRPLIFILFWSVGGSHSVLNAWEGCRGLKGKSVLWGHFSQACLVHSKGSTKSLHCAKSKSFNHDGNKTFS